MVIHYYTTYSIVRRSLSAHTYKSSVQSVFWHAAVGSILDQLPRLWLASYTVNIVVEVLSMNAAAAAAASTAQSLS